MDERIPLLIDTDPGVDDALALLMAFADPRHEVVGLTIAAGNVGLGHTVGNALRLCEVVGRTDVPVFPGCDRPLLHPSPDAANVHGEDGFGDAGLPAAKHSAQSRHAAEAIIELSHRHAGRLLLVALGPLTNIALALRLDPTLPSRVARLVVMGGAVTGHGNVTPSAEFNVFFDPEAAHIVFQAFPCFDLCDWEAAVAHGYVHADVDAWLQDGGAAAEFYDAISRYTRRWSEDARGKRWFSADSLAMAMALRPDGVLEAADRPVDVVLGHSPARGATVVDWQRQLGRPDQARILLHYDQALLEGLVRGALRAD